VKVSTWTGAGGRGASSCRVGPPEGLTVAGMGSCSCTSVEKVRMVRCAVYGVVGRVLSLSPDAKSVGLGMGAYVAL